MSKKLCLVLSIILAATTLAACAPAAPVQPTTAPTATAAAAVQPTTAAREIPQSGDLCGGTGGKGQIVSVGNNEFTIKRNDNGNDQIIHLTGQATIKTSTGSASLSDLKVGSSVTLVGSSNPDGSFTAYIVVVCN